MEVTGAHRVTVDALGHDFGTAATLKRLVDTKDERAARGEGRNQQAQQGAADGEMVALDAPALIQFHCPQGSGHRPPARGEECADDQYQGMRPHVAGEGWCERRQQR